MNPLATSPQTYFTTFAHTQRDLFANTISSYRDTWRMLLKYLSATLGVPADALDFDVVTATNVTGFPDHLEQERGNNAKTRNTRRRSAAATPVALMYPGRTRLGSGARARPTQHLSAGTARGQESEVRRRQPQRDRYRMTPVAAARCRQDQSQRKCTSSALDPGQKWYRPGLRLAAW